MNNLLLSLKNLGPGIIFAGAAIGGSHLIYSTKAGAEYGYGLALIIILVNLLKYPFYEYGHRYASGMKEHLLSGYKRIGSWALLSYIVIACITVIPNQSAVTLIAGALLNQLTKTLSPFQWSIFINLICLTIVLLGRYKVLDKLMKGIVLVLGIGTMTALILALINDTSTPVEGFDPPTILSLSGLAFLIKLMGWMPAPMEVSVWSSLWCLEKQKVSPGDNTMKRSLFDFRFGYISSIVMAIIFLSLGTTMMFGSGTLFSSSGVGFTMQLVELYTKSLGDWSWGLISLAAFITLFSTTLASLDGYTRGLTTAFSTYKGINDKTQKKLRLVIISLICFGVFLMTSQFKNMLIVSGIATTVSFLSSPLIGYLNFKAVTLKEFPDDLKPKKGLTTLTFAGLAFLIIFGLAFILTKLGIL